MEDDMKQLNEGGIEFQACLFGVCRNCSSGEYQLALKAAERYCFGENGWEGKNFVEVEKFGVRLIYKEAKQQALSIHNSEDNNNMGVFHGDLDRSAGVQVASSATTSKIRRNDLNDITTMQQQDPVKVLELIIKRTSSTSTAKGLDERATAAVLKIAPLRKPYLDRALFFPDLLFLCNSQLTTHLIRELRNESQERGCSLWLASAVGGLCCDCCFCIATGMVAEWWLLQQKLCLVVLFLAPLVCSQFK